jgi:hypothetical protein
MMVLAGVTAGATLLRNLPARARRRSWRIYRCSVRGRRASQATKNYCANLRFKNFGTAFTHMPPHGANVRIVQIDVSKQEYFRLFVRRRARAVDLRKL